MTDDIPGVRPPRRIYRLGYGSDAWEWPPHEFVGNGRWDDPDGRYRVLYASSERLGPFVETMGDFETDPYLEAVWLQIDGEDEATGPGQAPSDWLKVHRVFGTAAVKGPFAASARTRSLRFFQDRLGSFAAIHGFAVIDAAAIRERTMSGRALTQAISRLVHECKVHWRWTIRRFQGIQYRSRHGDDFENWAIFEPCKVKRRTNRVVDENDPDFKTALQLLGLIPPA